MTNETTASQPKSIGNDERFLNLLQDYRTEGTQAQERRIVAYIDSKISAPVAKGLTHEAEKSAYQRGFTNGYNRGREKEDYIENPTGRAPAAQASATIQAAPDVGAMPSKALEVAGQQCGFPGADWGRLCHPAEIEPMKASGYYFRTVYGAPLAATVKAVPKIRITLRQARRLVDFFGGHDADVTVTERPADWEQVEEGLYAFCTEYPEDGAQFLGATEVDDELMRLGTVKAVPSEALDAAPEIIGWYRDEQIDVNSDSQGLPERLVPHRALTKGASRPRGDGWKAVVEFAAPLADKTGGGE